MVILMLPTAILACGFEWLQRGWQAEQEHLGAIAMPRAGWTAALPPPSPLMLSRARVEAKYGWLRRAMPRRFRHVVDRTTSVDLFGWQIGDTWIDAAQVESVANLSHLKTIKWTGGNLKADALRSLARLEELETVVFSELNPGRHPRPVAQPHLAELAAIPRLRELHLTVHSVEDAGLEHVGQATSLETLVLRRNPIDGTGLKHLAGLGRLRKLDLAQTQVRSGSLVHLVELNRLRELDLTETRIGDDGVEHLVKLTWLEELRVDRTRLSVEGMKRLREGLPGVRVTGFEE